MGLALTTSCAEENNMGDKNKIIDEKEKAVEIPILNDKELELIHSLLEEKTKDNAVSKEFSNFSLCVFLLFLTGMILGIRRYFQPTLHELDFQPTVTFVRLIVLCFIVVGYVIQKKFNLSPLSKLNELGLEKRLRSFVTCQIKELKERIKPEVNDKKKVYIIQQIQHI